MRFPFVSELKWVIWAVLVLAGAAHFYIGLSFAWPVYLALFVLCFCARERPRSILADPLSLKAMVDGKVVKVNQQASHPMFPDGCIAITLRQSNLGEFVLHSPTEGQVIKRWWPRKKDRTYRGFGFAVRTDEGDIAVVNTTPDASIWFKSMLISSGRRVGQGARCGILGLGSRLSLLLPPTAKTAVTVGELVFAGETVLAKFAPHQARDLSVAFVE